MCPTWGRSSPGSHAKTLCVVTLSAAPGPVVEMLCRSACQHLEVLKEVLALGRLPLAGLAGFA